MSNTDEVTAPMRDDAGVSAWIKRALDGVERVGNRLPAPVTLFAILCVLVVIASWLAAAFGVAVTHPGKQETVVAVNLLSQDGIRRMFVEAVDNFTAFPPLGTVLVAMIGIGVAERSNLISAALRQLVLSVPSSAMTATLVFGGVMSSMAADAGYVVLTPLGAVLFAGIGRHPLAGLAAAFAGVSGGFSANLLLTSLDPLLSGLSTAAAQMVDSQYDVKPTANYYFMITSVFLVTLVGTWVTDRIVEPRLGKWTPAANFTHEGAGDALGELERKGLWLALAAFVGVGVLIALLVLPEGGILRGADGGLGPFYESLVPLIMLGFIVPGLVYGVVTGSIRSDKAVEKMTGDTLATMGAYIVLAFVAAQFVAYFSWSNLGLIFAVKGAELLTQLGLSGIILILGFIFVSGTINLFVGSASAKWAIMAPVFIPMLMLKGYAPETVQAAYRIGDSTTNIITPLMPYFPIIIAFAKKYDPRVGLGTLIAAMLPYSVALALAWTVLMLVWSLMGLPFGPDAPFHYAPAGG